ncbi:MAG: hypothetical protein LBE13_08570 [Bacteroidales bacterium]|jgi:hypothetical protein|nr:hypothetical protein [Bacteroidales bacterium]
MRSSNASASAFGWDFQSNAAIMLMLKNITIAVSVKVEGENEDIEITLNDKKVLYVQAKSVFNPDDYSNVIAKLQAGLKTLNEAAKKTTNVACLIYVTNSPNPFNDVQTMYAFSGSLTLLQYSDLPNLGKAKIEKLYKKNGYTFDLDLLSIFVMQFHGDDDNRCKVIKDLTNEFLESVGLSEYGLGTKILKIWQNDFLRNATLRNISVTISKKQMIWPLIVSRCEISEDDTLLDEYDKGDVDEINKRYGAIINNKVEQFEFITKIMSAYNVFEPAISSAERTKKFIASQWHNFKDEFYVSNIEEKILEVVVKLALNNVIKSRRLISKLKKEVNL